MPLFSHKTAHSHMYQYTKHVLEREQTQKNVKILREKNKYQIK